MFEVKYDSRDISFKKPFGAVKQTEKIEFNIETSEVCSVELIIKSKSGFESFDMEYAGEENNIYRYRIEFDTSQYSGSVYYYFRITHNDNVYYYVRNDKLSSLGELCSEKPDFDNCIGLTDDNIVDTFYCVNVYNHEYSVPEWFKTGISYHIFVDRFNNDDSTLENVNKDLTEVYGGNLKGIINKLDYLQELGITIIYLSPIFEADGAHKYNIGDYESIASDFGDIDTFKELITEIKKRNMHLILDGVFNHSGSDSRYFNKENSYDSIGAYQSKDSEYYGWYIFEEYPDGYKCWRGIDTLPEYNQKNEDLIDYLFYNKNSVLNKWLNLGIDGWRLDAADLLEDESIKHIYKVTKENNPNSVIIGELWNNATTFVNEDNKVVKSYMCGNELESVTNYPFHGMIIDYSKGEFTPRTFAKKAYSLIEDYPSEYYSSLWNFTGTHDVPRLLTLLDGDIDALKMCAALIMTSPGVPMIYYGDEAGLSGDGDPENRKPFPWTSMNMDIYNHFRELISIRSDSEALKKGSIHFIENDDFLIYERSFEDESVFVVMNNSDSKVFNINLISDNIKLEDIQSNEIYDSSNPSFKLDKTSFKILKK